MSHTLSYLFYTSILFSSTFLVYCIFKINSKQFQFFGITALSVIYSLPLALRGTTGTDSLQYYTMYNYGLSNWRRDNKIESGFLWLMLFCRNAHFPICFFYFLIAFITLFCFYLVLFFERPNINAGIACFFYMSVIYVQAFNICRQTMALSITFLALDLVIRGKKISPIILIYIASLFHVSAIIGFIIYAIIIIYKLNNTTNRFLLKMSIVLIVISLLFTLNPNLIGRFVLKFLNNQYYADYFSRVSLNALLVVKNLFISLPVIYILLKKIDMQSKWNIIISTIALLGLITTSMGKDTSRFGLYMLIFCSLALSARQNRDIRILNMNFNEKNVLFVLYLYYLIIFVFHYFYKGYCELIPYVPMWR